MNHQLRPYSHSTATSNASNTSKTPNFLSHTLFKTSITTDHTRVFETPYLAKPYDEHQSFATCLRTATHIDSEYHKTPRTLSKKLLRILLTTVHTPTYETRYLEIPFITHHLPPISQKTAKATNFEYHKIRRFLSDK